ncbi:unnamed protein product [Cyprideis torosa]|uniref:Uncharacterized protein n=1 Tax=Cyprideis torosa TaxID=163714 RepID=A0A7R8ZXY9_9CRUS|nr:unnamed protein product [Cyprideis torosa]CAG0907812.1 unnamed protein product [Cyprideis torosa]
MDNDGGVPRNSVNDFYHREIGETSNDGNRISALRCLHLPPVLLFRWACLPDRPPVRIPSDHLGRLPSGLRLHSRGVPHQSESHRRGNLLWGRQTRGHDHSNHCPGDVEAVDPSGDGYLRCSSHPGGPRLCVPSHRDQGPRNGRCPMNLLHVFRNGR